ncbi:hypothetical protein D9M73_139360 [compost metagenome]
MPLARGDAKPAHGQRLVLRDSLAVEQNLPGQGLGLDFTFTCGDQDGLGGAGRTFVEHGAQAFAVEHFLSA